MPRTAAAAAARGCIRVVWAIAVLQLVTLDVAAANANALLMRYAPALEVPCDPLLRSPMRRARERAGAAPRAAESLLAHVW